MPPHFGPTETVAEVGDSPSQCWCYCHPCLRCMAGQDRHRVARSWLKPAVSGPTGRHSPSRLAGAEEQWCQQWHRWTFCYRSPGPRSSAAGWSWDHAGLHHHLYLVWICCNAPLIDHMTQEPNYSLLEAVLHQFQMEICLSDGHEH